MERRSARIIFDARWRGQHGIGRFAGELRKRLSGVEDLGLGGNPASPADPVRTAFVLNRIAADCFFSPGFNAPLFPPCPAVLTIHDLIHLDFPQESGWRRKAYYRLIVKKSLLRSPLTFTVSEFSKARICEVFGLSEERVAVVGNGVSPAFQADGAVSDFGGRYALYVGNCKPHKNVPALLRAFAAVSKKHDLRLAMVCNRSKEAAQLLNGLGIEDRAIFLNGLDDHDLASVYRGAACLVLPSFYEGFGLPVVEAMACGCPVIGANCSSIPEVAAGAATLFGPHSHDELAEAMDFVLSGDAEVQRRVAGGLRRAAEFSWAAVAEKVREGLDAVGFRVGVVDANDTSAADERGALFPSQESR